MASLVPMMRRLIKPGSTLSGRTVHAIFWSSASRIGRVLLLVRTLILARLLTTEEFGIVGITLLMLAFMDLAAQTGFRTALVQKKGDITPYLNTAWTLEVAKGLIIGGLLVAAAPLLSDFLNAPDSKRVIQVMAGTLMVSSLVNIGIVYFRKDLEQHKRFAFLMARSLMATVVTIILAFILQSAWALVFGILAGSVARVLVSYVLHPFRPRLQLDWPKANELWKFSRWIVGTSFLVYLLQHADRFFIGRILGPVSLGMYQLAYRLSQFVGLEMTRLSWEVAMPVYSKLQDNFDRLRKAYLQAMQLTAMVIFPISLGLIVIGSYFVPVVVGDKWNPIVPTMQLLAVAGILAALEAVGSMQLFPAIGRPYLTTRLQFIKLVLILAMLYPLTVSLELAGAALAITLGNLIVFPVALWLTRTTLNCPLSSQVKVLLIPGASSLIMALVVQAAKLELTTQASLINVLWLIALGAAVYLLALVVLDRLFGQSIMRMVSTRFARHHSSA